MTTAREVETAIPLQYNDSVCNFQKIYSATNNNNNIIIINNNKIGNLNKFKKVKKF